MVSQHWTNPRQIGLPMKRTALATLLAATALVATPHAASAAQDTACKKAGMKTLQAAGLLDDVARGGLPISTAVALE